jgi:sugar lactone lactonase YvrE
VRFYPDAIRVQVSKRKSTPIVHGFPNTNTTVQDDRTAGIGADGMKRTVCPALRPMLAVLAMAWSRPVLAGAADSLRTQRSEVFEFTDSPTVTRAGDKITVAFTVREACDVTAAIESADGRIVRHLASGVLGANAPAPFQKDALRQVVTWDGKNDKGEYLDNRDALTVRVSLGLRPQFERTLFWSPKKRSPSLKYMQTPPLLAAAPEGMYVFDSGNGDHLTLFDHAGQYVRTVYPPPRDKLAQVQGLNWREFPHDGQKLPLKQGIGQSTFLLCSGTNDPAAWPTREAGGVQGMAVQGGSIVLAGQRINCLATDGSSGGRPLVGPEVWNPVRLGVMHEYKGGTELLAPESLAFSPDGKWLYLTGYFYLRSWHQGGLNGVMRMPADGSAKPETFVGHLRQGSPGKADGQFNSASCVACDAAGNVYVGDYGNNRVQVFDAAGKFLRSLAVNKPACVRVSPKDGQIYVFSWTLPFVDAEPNRSPPATLTRFGPLDKPAVLATYPLRIENGLVDGNTCRAEVDFATEPPTIWLCESGVGATWFSSKLEDANIRLLVEQGGKLVVKQDFHKEAAREVVFTRPTRHMKQRLYFDALNRQLYVGELIEPAVIHATSMADAARIDPESGKVSWIHLPFDAEDMAFDMDGMVYLRTENRISRFDATTWREVPFDYGLECPQITSLGMKIGKASSAIEFVGFYESSSQLGGLCVSPRGNIAVTVFNTENAAERGEPRSLAGAGVAKYTPQLYPGRARPWEVHVFDKHGRILYEDAVAGIGRPVGIGMDVRDDLYLMIAGVGRIHGQLHWNPISCTYLKTPPKSKFLATLAPVPLPAESRPKREPEIHGVEWAGDIWAEGAAWVQGGVGWDGKRMKCHCTSQSRPALDYLGRSFLPEVDHYSVLVLDTAGNEIVRIGRYGNVDDGVPLVKAGGPPDPRPMGGDEVAIMHGQMLAVQSDRRLFISDLGNARIASVKLGYHAEAHVPLKDVKDTK